MAKKITNNELKLEELSISPSKLKNIKLGFNEDAFLLMFNCDKEHDDIAEYAVSIPTKELKKIIFNLYQIGNHYEEQYGNKIGFSSEKEEV